MNPFGNQNALLAKLLQQAQISSNLIQQSQNLQLLSNPVLQQPQQQPQQPQVSLDPNAKPGITPDVRAKVVEVVYVDFV